MADDQQSDDSHWRSQFWVTVALLLALVVVSIVLLASANTNESVWQHRTYVFAAVDAVALTAIGWLFGREVHRGEAQAAKTDAKQVRTQLNTTTEQLATASRNSARLHAKLTALASAVSNAQTSGTNGAGGAPQGAHVEALKVALAGDLDGARRLAAALDGAGGPDGQQPPAATATSSLVMLKGLAATLIIDEQTQPTP
ncbi:MAG TPA: hypothetical protein VKV06_02085 [Acidimicrobiales bacterium]|nr:hypothetical protein [Acidimicrobiales bacterium]